MPFLGVMPYKMDKVNFDTLDEKDVRGMSLDLEQEFFACWGKNEAFLYHFKPFEIDFSFSNFDNVNLFADLTLEQRIKKQEEIISKQVEQLKQ